MYWCLVTTLLLSLLVWPLTLKAAEDLCLPAWFWNTPLANSQLIAVGYSTPYYTPQSSYNEAFNVAAQRLWFDRNCHITAKRIALSEPGVYLPIAKSLTIEKDTTGFSAFRKNLVRLDSTWTDRLVVMLVSTHPLPNLDSHLQSSPTILKPADYKHPDYIFATAYQPEYAYESSSWLELEIEARRNLAQNADSRIRVLRKRAPLVHETVIDGVSSVCFTNIQTIARAVDEATGARWILVSVHTSNVYRNE